MQNFIITLLICSVVMSGLALLYMAATPFLAKRYSEKWRYYAWLVIVVGLIIPFRPQWGNALFNVEVPNNVPSPAVMGDISPSVVVSGEALNQFIPPITLSPVENAVVFNTALNISWWHVGLAVWLAGVILFIAYHSVKHYRFMKIVRRWSENSTDERLMFLLENLKSEMGITRRIPIYICECIGSPMMIGVIKPWILLPTKESAQDELCFILKHELVHYKRKDLLYKYLVLAAMALHWFNPVVYLMARAINNLCEMSCDTEIVKSMDADARQSYSETIIGVVKYQSKLKTALSTNFYGGKRGMKNRISSIMDTSKKRAGVVITCLILAVTMSTGVVFAATSSNDSITDNNSRIMPEGHRATIDDLRNMAEEARANVNEMRNLLEERLYAYREFGLIFNRENLTLYYNSRRVGVFYDTYLSSRPLYGIPDNEGLRVYAVRDSYGTLIGVEIAAVYSSESEPEHNNIQIQTQGSHTIIDIDIPHIYKTARFIPENPVFLGVEVRPGDIITFEFTDGGNAFLGWTHDTTFPLRTVNIANTPRGTSHTLTIGGEAEAYHLYVFAPYTEPITDTITPSYTNIRGRIIIDRAS